MKILYLAHRIPYPPNKGDKIRSFNEIKYLSNSHEIDLVCLADNPADVQFQEDLKKYCRKSFVHPFNTTLSKLKCLVHLVAGSCISVGYFYWKKVRKIVDQWLDDTEYDAIICFSSPMAEYILRSKKVRTARAQGTRRKVQGKDLSPKPLLIMDFCDVDSDKWGQYAKLSSFPKSFIYRLENRRLAFYERKIAEQFDHSVFVSDKEAEMFLNQNPHVTNVTVIPNGVDYDYFAPQKRLKAQGSGPKEIQANTMRVRPGVKSEISSMTHAPCPMLLFTGAMDYQANVDGVTWFCNKILPEIRASIPKLSLHIVGSNPSRKVRNLDNGNIIKVTGFVEDIRPYYETAHACVIPLRLSRGIQNKVLEAMSMEKPVITTSQAIQGINALDGKHLFVANEPNEFAQAVVTLLSDTKRRRELGARAREFVKANHNWQTNMKRLAELLDQSRWSPVLQREVASEQ